jgi:hypothetical protein
MTDWQPIATAPRDCASILGANCRSKIIAVTWRHDIESTDYCIRGDFWKPTHWQPLPVPPVES